jgi:hypothetical protein
VYVGEEVSALNSRCRNGTTCNDFCIIASHSDGIARGTSESINGSYSAYCENGDYVGDESPCDLEILKMNKIDP